MANVEKRIVIPGQAPKNVERIDVENSDEPWTVIKLTDGSTLRLKNVVTDVWKVVDEYDDEGNPMYSIRVNGVMVVEAPSNLKARKSS